MTETSKYFDTVIVGLGKTGFSSACFLSDQNIRFAVTDSRKEPPMLESMQKKFPDVPLYLGSIDDELLLNANELLVSPGVSLHEKAIEKAIQNGARVYGDVELFCQKINTPIIAITGSNGKSTVTTLTAEMIREAGMGVAIGGNLGTPALDLLHESKPDLYVLELSSFQLETVSSLNAAAAVVLNISEDHMDRYEDMGDYATAKSHIYKGDGAMIVNLDDPYVAEMKNEGRNIIGFTLGEPSGNTYGIRVYDKERWLMKGDQKLIPAAKLCIQGDHNISNALAALALGDAISLPEKAMLNALQKYSGLPHRCQFVAEINGVAWYNDSKGTNVGATCAAIEGMAGHGNLILIAGGMSKGANFKRLAEAAKDRLRAAIVIGADGPLIKESLEDLVPVYETGDMQKAVSTAAKLATTGDVVLLSPACASFDMFIDYQDRGNAFIEAVEKLK
ncbi:MAG: UDP-N-acetylmuramoyl-L-alanine--D-glutamate ligase [Gammaproteobacteria bacterium]